MLKALTARHMALRLLLCAALGASTVLAFAPIGAFPLLPLTLGSL